MDQSAPSFISPCCQWQKSSSKSQLYWFSGSGVVEGVVVGNVDVVGFEVDSTDVTEDVVCDVVVGSE